MQSDRRLHPLSILFAFVTQIRVFVVPGILVLVGASSRGGDWQPWMMLFIIPSALIAALRYVSYRYRYDPNELVIHSGLIFRKERHIPYARIHNVDGVQRVLHRMLGVVEVRVQTGAGQEPEATMSVLPLAAFEEMRHRVFAARHDLAGASSPAAPARVLDVPDAAGVTSVNGATGSRGASGGTATSQTTTLLQLSPRDLLLCGLIEHRGAVLIAAAMSVVWELGFLDRALPGAFGPDVTGRGVVRALLRSGVTGAEVSWERVGIAVLGFVALLVLIALLSMVWALVRLYGFRLTLEDDDLRSEFGLLTHVAATIPLRRVQTLTVRETPLHRLFDRVAVKVETAGGRAREGGGDAEREWLAPILHRAALSAFVCRVLPSIEIATVNWQAVAPGAFRREIKSWLVTAALIMVPFAWTMRWWSLAVAPFLVAWVVVGARQTVRRMGWAVTGDAVLFRSGWLWRRVTVVRFAKIQTVTCVESPLDRRALMARVRVDTAGASNRAGRVNIPYLGRETATALFMDLSSEAADTQFKW